MQKKHMTRKRYDDHSTEFGLWLRRQHRLDSKLGYITTNIDYLWMNYRDQKYMLIEEKRYGATVRYPQSELFKILDENCKHDARYCGFHILVFENTNPDDGKIFLDDTEITRAQLIRFLQFDEKFADTL